MCFLSYLTMYVMILNPLDIGLKKVARGIYIGLNSAVDMKHCSSVTSLFD